MIVLNSVGCGKDVSSYNSAITRVLDSYGRVVTSYSRILHSLTSYLLVAKGQGLMMAQIHTAKDLFSPSHKGQSAE